MKNPNDCPSTDRARIIIEPHRLTAPISTVLELTISPHLQAVRHKDISCWAWVTCTASAWLKPRQSSNAHKNTTRTVAMAYWGEAFTYQHPFFAPAHDGPGEALMRLGPTPEARLAMAPTEREKGFLKAAGSLRVDSRHDGCSSHRLDECNGRTV